MILDIYKDSFEYSARNFPVLLIMGVLSFFGFLIIPWIVVAGYEYKVVNESIDSMINGGDKPPEFNNFKSLFKNGLKVIIVQIGYYFIPMLLIVLSRYVDGIAGNILFIVGLIILFLAFLYLFVAIPHMAFNNGSVKSAFDVGVLSKVIKSIGYLRYVISYLGVALISAVVMVVVFIVITMIFAIFGMAFSSVSSDGLSFVSLIGWAVINFVLFFVVSPYMSLFGNRCSSLIYNLRE